MSKQHRLTSAHLRVLAMGLMLVDHLGYAIFPQQLWMRMVGRLSFPIFAFLTAEGCRYTSSFRRYGLRLLIFGLISEIPYDLMITRHLIYLPHCNVMFTMLLGVLVVRCSQKQQSLGVIAALMGAAVLGADYGVFGVLMIWMFYAVDNCLHRLLFLALINLFGFPDWTTPMLGLQLPVQAFAIAAMIPICMYNGKKGGGRALQYGTYLFYPVHMLVIGLIAAF